MKKKFFLLSLGVLLFASRHAEADDTSADYYVYAALSTDSILLYSVLDDIPYNGTGIMTGGGMILSPLRGGISYSQVNAKPTKTHTYDFSGVTLSAVSVHIDYIVKSAFYAGGGFSYISLVNSSKKQSDIDAFVASFRFGFLFLARKNNAILDLTYENYQMDEKASNTAFSYQGWNSYKVAAGYRF